MNVGLVEQECGDRIVVVHDGPIWAAVLTAEDQRRHLAANPHGIAFIHRVALPALCVRGVSEAVVEDFVINDPARWLVGGDSAADLLPN